MKEHKGPVNSLELRANDAECVSASSDGSCIVWDLNRFTRANSLFASTFFKAVLYHPDESQLVTTGTDRKITYWDAFDGQAIRIVDGSDSAEINSIDISADGAAIVSGGADKDVKVRLRYTCTSQGWVAKGLPEWDVYGYMSFAARLTGEWAGWCSCGATTRGTATSPGVGTRG